MKEIELIEKRKPREKHFLQEDGTIIAKVYNEDIHYLKDGEYKEIDNALVNKNGIISNKSNDYKVEFKENFKESLMKMTKDNHYIDFKIRESKLGNLNTEKRKLSKKTKNITYNNITDDIKIEYQTLSNKVKETIVLQNSNYSKLSFELDTDLSLTEESGEIISKDINGNIIFRIEKPFMIDSNDIRNDKIHYSLESFDDGYILTLVLDDEWLNDNKRTFPVYIDPTITNENQSTNLYDTYIYPGDTNDTRSNKPYLKAGVEKVNGVDRINRTLIKFDLPEIGTGSEIVDAYIELVPFLSSTNSSDENIKLVEIHRITQDWTEDTANWATMNDKYDTKVEELFTCNRSYLDGNNLMAMMSGGALTNLVKKWYRDTPNYGIMIKSVNESYTDEDFPAFYSNDNNINGSPKPHIYIIYKNQNGLENYLNYKQQQFTNGDAYVNTYNGNLTTIFKIGKTKNNQIPINLNLIYNTNDVVLKNSTAFGLGFRLNFEQTIKSITIDNITYLEYIDEDGTIHYFYNYPSENEDTEIYKDEDGLGLSIEKYSTKCIMKDNYNYSKTFIYDNGIYYLSEMSGINDNKVSVIYDSNKRITKLIDTTNEEITITYNNSLIEVMSFDRTIKLIYNNNNLTSIQFKEGITTLLYDDNSLISQISDLTGLKINYEYYSKKPYRMKKVKQYGINNGIGQSYTLEYGFESTTIIDNKERCETLIFNSNGSLLSMNSLGGNEDISSAYSISQEFGDGISTQNNNKIVSSSIPVKYIKNYLKNSSFEDNDMNFTALAGISMSFSTNSPYQGSKCLKLDSTQENSYIQQYIPLLETKKYYTFSGYFKSTCDIKIELSFIDEEQNEIISNQIISSSDEYDREDISIYYSENAESNLMIKIYALDTGTIYIDNIQLEEGEIANGYNIIDNSDFSNGLDDWEISVIKEEETSVDPSEVFEVVTISNNKKALHISMNPMYTSRMRKRYPIKGKEGDLYTIAFWYKNTGVGSCRPYAGNKVTVYFEPADGGAEYCIPFKELNAHESKWQYFSYRSRALEDFNSIELLFEQNTEANDLYITNISFYRETTSGDFNYDENGNLISFKDQSNSENIFKYDSNNQLIKSTNAKGKNFTYEYDNKERDVVLSAISSMGVANEVRYNSLGNPVTTKIIRKYKEEINNDNYRIRSKGTDCYIKSRYRDIVVEEDACSNTVWNFVKEGDYYKIIYSILPNYSLSYENNTIKLTGLDQNNLFILEKNDNGSYCIRAKDLSNQSKNYLKVNENNLEFDFYSSDEPTIQFYIELADGIFIENNAIYTDDNKYIKTIIDNNLNKTTYAIDDNTGLITSTTNPKGITTTFQYNDKQQISSITEGNKTVSYEYYGNLISKIIRDNLIYKFAYNEFLNLINVKIGNDYTLINNSYENNNGNLLSSTYGNGHQISFEYDDFDRFKTINRMDTTYNYKYDNNGNIAKILSDNHIIKFLYDVSNRLYKYQDNEFKINYTYDANDNITTKKYSLGNINNNVTYTIDNNELITSVSIDGSQTNCTYDSLGRLINKVLPNNYESKYEYLTHGKRTTELIKKFEFGNNKESFVYDSQNNITEIYDTTDQKVKEFTYNDFNEVLVEKDLESNKSRLYNYDDYGNLLSIVTKNNSTDEIINSIIYKYENSNWQDQLTDCDGESITYDEIGNPISVGSNISMNWINGTMLRQYSDTSNNINLTYCYDENGIRNKKVLNGIETTYFTENDQIIYEKTNNTIIYYIYDFTGIIGLKYNNNTYYFEKNMYGDVIGIMDENGNTIVKYKYDIWGNIIKISDANGNDISDVNNIGIMNPIRYRSYYYDNETGLYYLNSRYYNPKWRRFLNPDSTICSNQDYLSTNLYIYSGNNPVNNMDLSGNFWKKVVKKIKKTVKTVKKIAKTVKKVVTKVVTNTAKTVAKAFINAAANVYLGVKGYNVSSAMFSKAIYNPSGNISKSIQEAIKDKSKNSPQVTQAVNSCIAQNSGKNSFSGCLGFDDAEMQGDLYYSLQHVDIYVSGTKISNDTWDITVSMKDDYNFEKRQGNDFNTRVNNLGYWMQENGLLTTYTWNTSYHMIVK